MILLRARFLRLGYFLINQFRQQHWEKELLKLELDHIRKTVVQLNRINRTIHKLLEPKHKNSQDN